MIGSTKWIDDARKRATQAEQCRGYDDNPGDEQTQDVDALRNAIIGGLVGDKFPMVLRLQPKRTEAENSVEFAPFSCFLALLANETELIDRLTKAVNEVFSDRS